MSAVSSPGLYQSERLVQMVSTALHLPPTSFIYWTYTWHVSYTPWLCSMVQAKNDVLLSEP
jgi:hypothetical protein